MIKKVTLVNMGGIKKPIDITIFLFNMFNDKNILPFRQPFRAALSAVITALRMRSTYSIYKKIGASPIFKITKKQANKLKDRLNMDCDFGFVYSKPFVKNKEYSLYIPLYGFYSHTTHGQLMGFKKKVFAPFCIFGEFFDLIEAQINKAIKDIPSNFKAAILLSAHSLPEKLALNSKDPYRNDLEIFSKYLKKRFDLPIFLSFQSKLGPVKWFEPNTIDMINALSKEYDALLVVPISFISDNSETIYEIDIEYKDLADNLGIKYFKRLECFNDKDEFINFLAKYL
jgi:ferrochelatase